MDSIKDVVRSSVTVPEFDKHLKKAGGRIGRNVVEITIKMKSIVRKPLMIKISVFISNNSIYHNNTISLPKTVWVIWVSWHTNFVGYLIPHPFFYTNNQFSISTQFKCKCTVCKSKTLLFQAVLFCHTVRIQSIQFCISTDFVYMLLNIKTVLLQTIQFCVRTILNVQTVIFQKIQLNINTQFRSI